MKIVEIPLSRLRQAPWNPNSMEDAMMGRLKESLRRFEVMRNLVVRPLGDGAYEVISGNQLLRVLGEMELKTAPCLVANLDQTQARLLAQVMNHIHGEDDLGLRAQLMREILGSLSEEEVVAILPETAEGLRALTRMGQESLAQYIREWERVQGARLNHLTFQLTGAQLEIVKSALGLAEMDVKGSMESPNIRGSALTAICRDYLQKGGIV